MPLQKEELGNAVAELRKGLAKRKFKQSIELIVKLRDIDLKKPENRIQETIELPNPLDRETKVCVVAGGDLARRAKAGGADRVLTREELEALGKDKKAAKKLAQEHDFFIAEAPLMPLVGRIIGPVLGPRGKMPTPVPPTAPIENIIQNHRKLVRVRIRDQPVLQCSIATETMKDEQVIQNIQTVFSRIESKLERGIRNVRAVMIKPTMGPAVRVVSAKA
jgi:large subunit ribosomal protein L1